MYKNTLSALHRRYTHIQCPKPMRREVHKPKLAPISDAGFFPHRRQLHIILFGVRKSRHHDTSTYYCLSL